MPRKGTTPSAVRIPPHSYEAEESVLGSLIIDKNAMIRVADLLEPDDFYKEAHRLTYAAMVDLYQQSDPLDVLSLTNRLKEKQQLDSVGGETAVTHLATVVPTAGNVSHYARIVKKTATLRRLISAASNINDLGFNEEEEIDVVLDHAEQALFSVSQDHKQYSFTKIADALEEAFVRIDKLHKGDHDLRGVTTGFSSLDSKLAGWQKSDLVILAARPSVGKTSIALDFARHAALAGIPVGFFSLEMSKEQLVDRLLAAHAHVDLWRLRTGRLETGGEFDDFSRLGQAMGELSNAPIYIDDHSSNSVMGIRTMARRLQAEHGLGLLIIDYLQLMESSRYSDNRVQEVSDISRSLKRLAIELNIPVIALSQLSRAVEMRPDQRPKLSDLRESGCLTGDTLITRADTGERIPIKQLAERANQTPIPVFAVDEHYRTVIRPLTRAFPSGRKQIFELRTRSGRTIRASANHPFRTIDGWQALEDISPGIHIASFDASPQTKSLHSQHFRRDALHSYAAARSTHHSPGVRLQEKVVVVPHDQLLWDEIVSITPQGTADVYDATVPGVHNFVANDIFVHNSIEQDSDIVLFIHRQPFPEGQDRPEAYDISLLIEKHRNGPTGEVPMRFNSRFASYTEPEEHYVEFAQVGQQTPVQN